MKSLFEYLAKYFETPGPVLFETTYFFLLALVFNKDKDIKKIKTWLVMLFEMFLLWLIMFLFRFLRAKYFYSYGFFVALFLVLLTIGYGLIKYRKDIKLSLYYSLFLSAYSVYLTSFIQAVPDFFCVLLKIDTPVIASTISSCIVAPLMNIAMMFLIYKKPLDAYGKPTWKYIAIPSLLLVFSSLMQIYNMQITELLDKNDYYGQGTIAQEKRIFIFYIGIVLYTLIVLGYLYCYNSIKNAKEKKKVNSYLSDAKQYAIEAENMNEIIKMNLEEMRSIRHEVNNQLSYMQIMISQKNYDKLEEYLEQFNKNIPSSLEFCDTDNTIIRNILGMEQYKAKNQGIKIIPNVLVKQKLNIEDSDLAALLINLIDNAIEAIQFDKIEDAQIDLSIVEKNDFLLINILNPVAKAENNKLRLSLTTLKKDKSLHGHGTKIIKKIVEKYNGCFDYKIENGKFIVDIMISLLKEGKQND